ncbi:MAG: hypothetical protein WCD35_12355 [Mycobacteriales bacterium]
MELGDNCLAAACAALEPYSWRRLTPEMIVRRVLGAVDLSRGQGTGSPVPLEDRRVEALVGVVTAMQWRALTARGLCRRLLVALDDWYVRDRCLDLELAWLLEEGA